MLRMKASANACRPAWTLALGVVCILSAALPSFAQQAEIDSLASRVAQEIAKTGKKKVAVVDFVAVNGKSVPLGTCLADQFSAALARAGPSLEILDRAKLKGALEGRPRVPSKPSQLDPEAAQALCDSAGADILIMGNLAPAEKAVKATLNSYICAPLNGPKNTQVPTFSMEIPLTLEMQELMPELLDSRFAGVPEAGQGGYGMPACIQCPSPNLVARKFMGEVRLRITVTAQGEVKDIKVIKSLSKDLDKRAIEAVQKWKFKPARRPDGTPVAVRTVVAVTFTILP
jgi:TonB family protein